MRQFIAIINYDEGVVSRYCEENGLGDVTPGEYLEQEFGWIEQSGFSLEGWRLCDYDDSWDQYRMYVAEWAMNDVDQDDYKGESPLSYYEWLKEEK